MTFDFDKNKTPFKFHLNNSNSHIVYLQNLGKTAEDVTVNAVGTGIALTTVTYEFVDRAENDETSFDISVGNDKPGNTITLKICVNLKETISADKIGMSMVEINLPSGYEFKNETIMYNYLRNTRNLDVKVKLRLF